MPEVYEFLEAERIKYATRPTRFCRAGSAICSRAQSDDLRAMCAGSMPISAIRPEPGPASKNPSCPIVASAKQNLTHQSRTGREKQLFFEVLIIHYLEQHQRGQILCTRFLIGYHELSAMCRLWTKPLPRPAPRS